MMRPLTHPICLAVSLALLLAAASPLGARRALAAAQDGGQRPELALQTAHATEVTAAACSPDGRTFVTGGDDGRVKVWDARTAELKRTLNAHRGPVSGIAFSPDGRTLMSSGWDGALKLWDAQSGAPAGSLPNPGRMAFTALAESSDGKVAAAGLGDPASPSDPALAASILVWDLRSRSLRQTIQEGSREVSALAFAPGGVTLVSGGADPAVKLWDANTGRLLAALAGHGDEITSVAFSHDGATLASGGRDGLVKIWDARTGAHRRDVSGEAGERNQVAFSRADGSLLVGNSQLKFVNPSDGSVRRQLEQATLRTTALSVSDDGGLAVAVGVSKVADDTPITDVPLSEQAHVWDARTGKFLRRLGGYAEGVTAVAAARGLLAAAAFDRVVRLWDAAEGRVLRALLHPARVWAVAFSPDAATLAVATGDMGRPGEVVIRDVASGRVKRRLNGHTLPARAVAYSPDGRTLASGGEDGAVRIWDAETGESLKTLSDSLRPVFALTYSPDGARIATGSFDHKVRLWDARTGNLLMTLKGHRESVFAVAYSPDGSRLASGSKDRRVKVWDAATGVEMLTLDTTSLRVTGLAFVNGGKLAASNDDGNVTIWDAFTGQLLLTLAGHELGVTGVAAVPGGPGVYSGGADNTVRLWDASAGHARVILYSLRPGETDTRTPAPPSGEGHFPPADLRTEYVVTTPEGFYASSLQAERLARFRIANDLFPAEGFQGPYLRPETVRRALAGQATPPGPALAGPLPPLVGFTSHRDGDTFTGAALDLSLSATDDRQVARVTIFVDGAPVRPGLVKLSDASAIPPHLWLGPRGIPGGHRLLRTATARILIPARRKTLRLRAIAHDDSGLQSRTEEITLTRR